MHFNASIYVQFEVCVSIVRKLFSCNVAFIFINVASLFGNVSKLYLLIFSVPVVYLC